MAKLNNPAYLVIEASREFRALYAFHYFKEPFKLPGQAEEEHLDRSTIGRNARPERRAPLATLWWLNRRATTTLAAVNVTQESNSSKG